MAENKNIIIWLKLIAFLVVAMVVLGGVTRLTGSGLSITDWKPITGIIPPFTLEDWLAQFKHYQQSVEYQKINFNMSLSEYKFIYYLEYFHRLLGRMVGVVFFLPALYFLYTKQISQDRYLRYGLILLLGGLQGAMGWYMVKSGLIDHPSVSHYRLAAHLILALLIYAVILLEIFHLSFKQVNYAKKDILQPIILPQKIVNWLLVILIVQIIYGAFVAGLDAGKIFNSFPLMDGKLVPSGFFSIKPLWLNFTENVITVQFIHRWLGVVSFVLALVLWILVAYNAKFIVEYKNLVTIMFLCVVAQVFLGIYTLLFCVPVWSASIHQLGAVMLFTIMFYIRNKYNCNYYDNH